jgi:hypothetical protein
LLCCRWARLAVGVFHVEWSASFSAPVMMAGRLVFLVYVPAEGYRPGILLTQCISKNKRGENEKQMDFLQKILKYFVSIFSENLIFIEIKATWKGN